MRDGRWSYSPSRTYVLYCTGLVRAGQRCRAHPPPRDKGCKNADGHGRRWRLRAPIPIGSSLQDPTAHQMGVLCRVHSPRYESTITPRAMRRASPTSNILHRKTPAGRPLNYHDQVTALTRAGGAARATNHGTTVRMGCKPGQHHDVLLYHPARYASADPDLKMNPTDRRIAAIIRDTLYIDGGY